MARTRGYTVPGATTLPSNDSDIVHISGTETVTGAKTFTAAAGTRIDGPLGLGTAPVASQSVRLNKTVTDPTTSVYGGFYGQALSLTANNSNILLAGSFLTSTTGAAFNATGTLYGTSNQVLHLTAGTLTRIVGIEGLVYNVSTGIVTRADAVQATIQNLNAGGTITDAYGVRAEIGFNVGTITNSYGLYVGDVTSGTQTNQAYGLYVSDTGARNFFAGPLAVGGALTLNDVNVVVGTTTGTQFGTATTQKVGFHGATATVQRAGAAQVAVAGTAATNTTPFGYTTAAQADAIVTLLNEIRAALVEKGIMKGSA